MVHTFFYITFRSDKAINCHFRNQKNENMGWYSLNHNFLIIYSFKCMPYQSQSKDCLQFLMPTGLISHTMKTLMVCISARHQSRWCPHRIYCHLDSGEIVRIFFFLLLKCLQHNLVALKEDEEDAAEVSIYCVDHSLSDPQTRVYLPEELLKVQPWSLFSSRCKHQTFSIAQTCALFRIFFEDLASIRRCEVEYKGIIADFVDWCNINHPRWQHGSGIQKESK